MIDIGLFGVEDVEPGVEPHVEVGVVEGAEAASIVILAPFCVSMIPYYAHIVFGNILIIFSCSNKVLLIYTKYWVIIFV